MKALYEKRGDQERPNIQTLSQMKQTIELQESGLSRGIFILTPEDAAHLQTAIIGIFNYAEQILLPGKQLEPQQTANATHSRNGSQNGAQPPHARGRSGQDIKKPVSNEPIKYGSPSPKPAVETPEPKKQILKKSSEVAKTVTKIQKREPNNETKMMADFNLQEKKKQDTIDPKDDFVPINVAEFPALGANVTTATLKPKPEKTEIKRLERKGNQKQRRGEIKNEVNSAANSPKLWTRQENGEAVPVDSPSVPRSVLIFN